MANSNVSRKKFKIGIFGIVLVSLLIISITLAYLQSHTGEETNTFTLGEGVEIKLIEKQENIKFSSGSVFEHTVTVKIPETAMDLEFVAVQVEYYVEEQDEKGKLYLKKIDNNTFLDSYAQLQTYADVDAITATGSTIRNGVRDGWVTKDQEHYYYGEMDSNNEIQLLKVSAGSEIHVFDKIRINDTYGERHCYTITTTDTELTNSYNVNVGTRGTVNIVRAGQLKTFHAIVTAYAVQGDISNVQAMEEFEYLFTHSASG